MQPLPEPLEAAAVIAAIAPEKDVDCFHPYNVGRLNIGDPVFSPCTPAGVMEMLREYGISPAGKAVCGAGPSNIVGKPMAALLIQADGTVTLCHSKTPDLADITRQADILVSAVGKVELRYCRHGEGRRSGHRRGHEPERGRKALRDVDFAAVEPKASYITPVPGGVGPMTRAMLMRNIPDRRGGSFEITVFPKKTSSSQTGEVFCHEKAQKKEMCLSSPLQGN